MNFKKWLHLNEVKVEKIKSKLSQKDLKIYVDPGYQELFRIIQNNHGSLRAIFHQGKNYMWSAREAIHKDVFNSMYLKGEFIGYFIKLHNNVIEPTGFYYANEFRDYLSDVEFDEVPSEILRYTNPMAA